MKSRIKSLVSLTLVLCLTLLSFPSADAANRPTTMALNGMVTTPHYLASQSAAKVLQEGGNAVDAAVAAAATLAVVYPHMNGIGGDNFWLIYNAHTDELKALNASGRSGEKATIDFYKKQGYDTIPARGYLSTNTVPGVISGWDEAYNYAKENMEQSLKWDRLLEDAIHYAEEGFPVTPSQERFTTQVIDPTDQEFKNLQRFKGFTDTFLNEDGEPYKAGEVFKQKPLSETLKMIAEKGADGFYKGEVAKKIVNELEANGGLLTLKDFEQHKANWVDPISADYRGYKAYNLPPNTQGVAALSILNIINNYDMKGLGEGTADYYHVLVEATKQAFADRDKYVTDPDFNDIPIEYLLSKEHGKEMAERIDMNKAAIEVKPLDPKGDTVWFGIVDKDGNAVSIIQSIYHEFGSGIVAEDTGVLLQNRGSYFSLDPNNINHLEPKKRTFHTLNPAMMFKEGKPFLVYGTMGGEGQPQTQAAMVTRIVDYGFSVQDAIEAPRWLHGRTWGASNNDLKLEGRVADEVVEEMLRRGHPVKVLDDYSETLGHAGAILIDPKTNVKYGGADPRGDGAAVGY
ncbi:gamma-glutamyltransferase [Sporosarcina limicola]|uniref:Glutathione hydrolase proenzyme n=1 Tax=Sporosarcina limicola TaxID=34101 RepID=A0A927MG80_9BACL|nr:gamma-glutamyltransferase [Sporosarcina limicola]MBE1554048.1 gamma-glutamyltranspeptidase/glutathione hydrolase [Sporosarcina limicola]